MNKEIFLTSNLFRHLVTFKQYDIEQLTAAGVKFGYNVKFIEPDKMVMPESIPYAAFNMHTIPTNTHLRFLRLLEQSGSRVLNPIYKSMMADDKMMFYLDLLDANVPVPKTIDLPVSWSSSWESIIKYAESELGFPCVLKASGSGLGYGVNLVHNKEQLDELIGLLGLVTYRQGQGHTTSNLVLQQYIPETFGRCVRVMSFNDRCIGGFLRTNTSRWKTGHLVKTQSGPGWGISGEGEIREYFEVDQDLAKLSMKIVSHLGLQFAGLDFLFGDSGFVLCEVNTSVNTKGFNDTHPDMNLAEILIERLVS